MKKINALEANSKITESLLSWTVSEVWQDHCQCIRIHAAMVAISEFKGRCSFSEGEDRQRIIGYVAK